MDGVSAFAAISAVAQAAVTAVKVVDSLQTFAKKVRHGDPTVSKLSAEVQLLQSLLVAIKLLFEENQDSLRDNRIVGVFWSTVKTVGENCRITVDRLNAVLRRLVRESSDTTPQAILKQLKLQLKTEETAELRTAIAAHHQMLQTAFGCLNVSFGVLSQAKLHQLEDDMDDLIHFRTRLIARAPHRSVSDETDGNRRLIENIESFRAAALPILSSASTVMDQMSTTGTERAELPAARRDKIEEWAEGLTGVPNTGATGTSIADSQRFNPRSPANSIVEMDPSCPSMSREQLNIRSKLIERGILAYSQSLYKVANDCFQDAVRQGLIGAQDPLSGFMADRTLDMWFMLTALRFERWSRPAYARYKNLPKPPRQPTISLDLLGSKIYPVDLDALRATRRLQDCLDACILSSILLHLGDVGEAETVCEAARVSIERLKGRKSKEHQDALLLMTEIQYSKGPREAAKVWCAQISTDALRGRFSEFISAYPLDREADNDASYRLRQAVDRENFPAALFILQTHPDSSLRFVKPKGANVASSYTLKRATERPFKHDYLTHAFETDSLAIASLLMERQPDLEEGSRDDGYHRTNISRGLFSAIENHNVALATILLEYGPSQGAIESSPPGPYWDTCVPLGISYGSDVGCYDRTFPLGAAIAAGCQEVVQLLLAKGESINGRGTGSYRTEPPLITAIRCPDGRKLVPMLLKAGADVNMSFRHIRPLSVAIYHSRPTEESADHHGEEISNRKLIESLVRAGAKPDRESVIGGRRISPLKQAREMGLWSIESLLLKYVPIDPTARVVFPRRRWWQRKSW